MIFYINTWINARERTPTITMINKFFVKIAARIVGSEANKLFQLIEGKCPKCWTKRLETHKADIITTGTKLKYSTSGWGRLTFLSKIKGKIRESKVTKPQIIIVNKIKLKEYMFYPHPYCTNYQSNKQN